MNRHFFLFCSAFLFLFCSSIRATIYDEIESRFYIHEPDQIIYTNTTSSQHNFVREFGTYRISNRDLYHLTFETLKRYDRHAGQGTQIDFDGETWNVLQLFNSAESVHKTINKTVTTVGSITLAKMMVNQTSEIERIHKRQAVIRRLSQDAKLRNRIESVLNEVKYHEAGFLSLIDSQHPIYDESLLHHHNKLPLEESGLYDAEYRKLNQNWQRTIKVVLDSWLLPGPAVKTFGLVVLALTLLRGLTSNTPTATEKAGYIATAAIISGLTAHDISLVIRLITQRINAFLYIRHHLRELHHYFSTLAELVELEKELIEFSDLDDEIDRTVLPDTPEIITLKNILKSSKCIGAGTKNENLLSYFWYETGDVIAAFNIFLKHRRELFKGIALIGSLDAYCSLAQIIADSRKTNTPYSFTQLVEHPAPYLQADGFWNPVVHNNITVTNNITLGGLDSARNGIVTGQPETGKSTMLRSIGLIAALGQGPGICPARAARITPFSAITMYGNIKDDMANKRSLFRSEVHRASSLLSQVRKRKPSEYTLTLTDEAFGGTEKYRGQAAAYASAYLIGSEPQNIGLYATYFDDLTLLSTEFPQTFSNYSLRLSRNVHTGEQYYPYILEYGANTRPLGTLALRKSRFPLEVIDMVEELERNSLDNE